VDHDPLCDRGYHDPGAAEELCRDLNLRAGSCQLSRVSCVLGDVLGHPTLFCAVQGGAGKYQEQLVSACTVS